MSIMLFFFLKLGFLNFRKQKNLGKNQKKSLQSREINENIKHKKKTKKTMKLATTLYNKFANILQRKLIVKVF